MKKFAVLLCVAACGGPSPGGSPDAGEVAFQEVPASTVPETGVRRDVFTVAGVTPPKNPTTGEDTPADLNATQVLRYRPDADPPVAVRAVVVAVPGFLGGGGSFDSLARALVRRGIDAGAPVEVWAIDRRSNLLEDLRGANTAEAAGDPEIANRYYFDDLPVGGKTFAGFLRQDQVSYMSEWGLTTHVEDLRRVLALVPAGDRQGHVFLLGHSLGGSFAETYAAWRFSDGKRGVEELAGLVLIDGVLDGAPISESEYQNGLTLVGMAFPGVPQIRSSRRYVALPLLGVEVYAHVEVMALRALTHPDTVTRDDDGRDQALRLLLSLGPSQLPPLTDAAALGLAFDDQSNPLAFARLSLGHASGGPLSAYNNPFGSEMLVHPSDPTATYTWTDALVAAPPEWTPLGRLAHSFVDGRSNFAEWYFPTRLALDLQAAGGARIGERSWQAAAGLRAYDGALIDAPILAVSAGLVPVASFTPLRDRVAPVLGAGRPFAGTARSDAKAFQVVRAAGMTHVDPLIAADRPENLVPVAVDTFVRDHAAAGTLVIPPM